MLILFLSLVLLALSSLFWAVLSIGSEVRKVRESVDVLSVVLSESRK